MELKYCCCWESEVHRMVQLLGPVVVCDSFFLIHVAFCNNPKQQISDHHPASKFFMYPPQNYDQQFRISLSVSDIVGSIAAQHSLNK